jgi:hypothetical protein
MGQSPAAEYPTRGITLGLQQGSNGTFAEFGYTFGNRINWPRTKLIKGLGSFTLGVETGPLSADKPIIAPKFAYTMNFFVTFGAAMLYYTDLKEGSLRFRPEVGISMLGIRLYYGWNFSVGKYREFPLNESFLGLSAYIPLESQERPGIKDR